MTVWFSGADGQRLAADIEGPQDGDPVLLVGGMGQTRHSWRQVALQLARSGRRAISLDFRGHGESDRAPDGDYSYPRQVADVAALAKQIGRPMTLVGNSLGGKICLAAAGTLGADAVARLAMVDAVPRSRPEGITNVARAMLVPADGFASPAEAAIQLAQVRGGTLASGTGARLQRNMRQDEAGRWHWHWDAGYRDPRHRIGLGAGSEYLEAQALAVRVPTLLAWCEYSEVVDAEGVAALRVLLPQLEVEIIAGARHTLVGDQNDIFADALIHFLERTGE